jgi:transposase InsO family protein
MTTKPYPQEAQNRREDPGELTHSDIWGPARVESLKKSKYAILFTDDATRHCKPDFLKRRDEAFEKIKEYIAWVERQYGYTPKVLRVDNAKELTSGAVKTWLKARGITLQNPAPYAHSSNGVAERFNQTIIELARAMLIAKDLPAFLWESAVEYAVYI